MQPTREADSMTKPEDALVELEHYGIRASVRMAFKKEIARHSTARSPNR